MENLEKVREIFHDAVELIGGERERYLDRATEGNRELRDRVERLLAGAERQDNFLASPTPAAPVKFSSEGVGTLIGRYKLVQLLGEGGFGSVWVAEQQDPVVRQVALKVIKLGMDTKQVIARFEAERQALAIMDHSSIARVFDAGATEAGRPYFVMELVKGEPITSYCDTNNVTIRDRLHLFVQVCQAVQYAHTKGIIHRDLKPSNVLVSTQDGEPLTKIIDFGIAKATAARLTEKTLLTEHEQFIGTPEYMSPEQAGGDLDVDTRSDVYSLGVLLYELLAGAPPFDARSLWSAGYAEIQRIIREVDPPRPSTRFSRLSDTMASVAASRDMEPQRLVSLLRGEPDWIVMKALEKDRARRYQTAGALADDVRRYLGGEPVLAAPPSRAYQARKFIARHKGPVVAGALVSAALVLGVIGTGIGLVRAEQHRRSAELNEKKALDEAGRAEREAARAVQAEREAKQRADELQKVVDFQYRILEGIDAFEAGESLQADLRRRHKDALVEANVAPAQREGHADALQAELDRINFADTAAAMIQRTLLEPSIQAIDEQFQQQPVIDASLRHALAGIYIALGRYEAALALEESALEQCRELLGADHPYTIKCLNGMGLVLLYQGKAAEAEAYLRAALESARRIHGPDHADTLSATNNLGQALKSQGKLSEAEPLIRKVVELNRRLRGPDVESTLLAEINLASLRRDQGDLAEAEAMLRPNLERCREVLGPDHSRTVSAMICLGSVLELAGRPAEAEQLFRQALESSQRRYGKEHPQTMAAMAGLGGALMDLRRFAEAERLLRVAVDGLADSSQKERLLALNRLGAVLGAQAKYAEAEECFSEALRHLRRVPDDYRTIVGKINLAGILRDRAKYAEAEALLLEALETSREILSPDHPQTLIAVNGLGSLLFSVGKYGQAEAYLEEAYRKMPEVMGENHPRTLRSIQNLASLRWQQGRLEEAEVLCRESLEKRRRVLGNEHPDTINSMIGMGVLLMDQERPDEAEPYVREAAFQSRTCLGEDHTMSLMAAARLAGLLRMQGKDSEAAALDLKTLEIQRRTLGEDHPDTLISHDTVGDTLWREGKPSDAAEHHRRALDGFLRKFGKDHAWTGDARLGLGRDLAAMGLFVEAEAELLEAQRVFFSAQGVSLSWKRICLESLVGFYEQWDTADSGAGHRSKADEWREMLEALPSTRPTNGPSS